MDNEGFCCIMFSRWIFSAFWGSKERGGPREGGGEGDSRELLMNTVCRWWASAACFWGRHFIFWGKMGWSQTEIVTRNSFWKREMGDFICVLADLGCKGLVKASRPWQWVRGRRYLRCSGLAGAGTHCWEGQTRPARAWIRLIGTCGVFPGVHVMIKWFGMQGNRSDGGEMRGTTWTHRSNLGSMVLA